MKKILPLIFAISFIHQLHAQVQKGAILTGGSISFYGGNSLYESSFNVRQQNGEYISLLRTDERKRNFFSLRPQVGIFTSEHLVLGGGLAYEYRSNKGITSIEGREDQVSEEKSNLVFINPYITKFSKLADKLYFTSTFNLLAGIGKEKSEGQRYEEQNILELGVDVNPGITYFLSEQLAFRVNIGRLFYTHRIEKSAKDSDLTNVSRISDYGLNISFNTFSIGVQYFLKN